MSGVGLATRGMATLPTTGGGGGGGGDVTPPSISALTPAPGELASRLTPVTFTVTDAGGLARVLLFIKYTSRNETYLVHDGTDFLTPFTGASNTRTPAAGGYDFQILHDGGWIGAFDLSILAIDAGGNVTGP